jgi:hypothetical protein
MGEIAVGLAKSPKAWAKLVSFFPAKSPILNFTINCDVEDREQLLENVVKDKNLSRTKFPTLFFLNHSRIQFNQQPSTSSIDRSIIGISMSDGLQFIGRRPLDP